MGRFSISYPVADIGESLQVVAIARAYDNRGDLSGATYTYTTVNAIIQLMDSESDGVKEGTFKPEDLTVYFDESTSVSGSLVIGNLLSGSFIGSGSNEYKIKEVIQNLGHYEVRAVKL